MMTSIRSCILFIGAIALAAGCSPRADDASPGSSAGSAAANDTGVGSLFDGATLTGWAGHMGLPEDQVGGLWEVGDGAIVGDQDPPGHGGFLVTDGEYSDFARALETMLDYPIDSGIFLRVGEEIGRAHV